jgi:phosphate-selective porin OprO/OprP
MLRIFSNRVFWLIGIGLFIGTSVFRTPDARAQDANAASVADLQQRVQDLEAVVRHMKEGQVPTAAPVDPTDPTAAAAPSPAPAAKAGADPVDPPAGGQATRAAENFIGWNNGFFLQSPDRTCQLRITGQIQADYRGFLDPVDSSSTANTNVAGSPVTGSPDTFLVRRARLGIEATMANYFEFRLLPDFAGSTVAKSITDAYMNVHYWDAFQFEIGKFKQPFSYEDLIQDRYVPTMERSMMDQLVPQCDEGAMIHGERLFCGRFDYALAASNGDPNDSGIATNNSKDFNARVVVRPFYDLDGCAILHGWQIGLAGSFGVEDDAVSTTSSTPPTITTPATVTWFAYNTGATADGVRRRISPELVYFYNSLGFAAQYYHQDQKLLRSTGPIEDVPMDGYYVMATYLLTGEQRHEYSQQIEPLRPFDPSAPMASPGAWELVFRVDRMEVGPQAFAGTTTGAAPTALAYNTGTTNRSSPEALEETTGLNWYLTKWSRAQLNWEHANFASPVQIGNMKKALAEEDALYARFQLIF